MATTAGGIGFLVLMGIMAVGFSDGGGSTPVSAGATPDGDGTLATCDAVVVVESAPGSPALPADTDAFDGDPATVCRMEVDEGDDEAIAALQQALVQCHGETLAIDGRYGPATAAAVSSVQQQAGLQTDGEYGPATMEAMQWPAGDPAGATACVAAGPQKAADDSPASLPATG